MFKAVLHSVQTALLLVAKSQDIKCEFLSRGSAIIFGSTCKLPGEKTLMPFSNPAFGIFE